MNRRSGNSSRASSNGRSAILSKIRKNVRNIEDPVREARVADRLSRSPVGLIPARARKSHDKQVDMFCEHATKVQASVTRLGSIEELPTALAEYLRNRNLPKKIRMGDAPFLQQAGWEKLPDLELSKGPSKGDDPVGLSQAFAGIAETGTLMLQSGSDNPTTLNFLPETHCVVVRTSDISGDFETAWAGVRERYGKGVMPRTVNMVTGPSRSGDIEQTMLLGAHGPRALQIFVVDD
jgi:L-lactate dehydrogenase complex protein LldG